MNIKTYLEEKSPEFLSNLFTLVWGLWVINPFSKAFTNVLVFKYMEVIAPEWLWGVVFTVTGIIGFVLMMLGIFNLRKIISETEVFLFLTLGIMTGVANFSSPATVIYLTISFCGLLSHNSILIEKRRRAGDYGKSNT